MADIFISYKRENRAVAEQLASALEQLGFDVWWDFALLSGDQYRKVIREVINQCKAAIVLWSVKAVDSEFVMDEAAHAKAQSKLCPARIDDVELPFGFGQTHTDDLREWTGEMGHPGFSSLLRALEAKCGKQARLGARPRDAAGERQFAELEAFKAAQLSGNDDALRAFVRQHPSSAFSAFVRSQLGEGPAPGARPSESASFASAATARPREKEKGSPWPVIALLALLVAGGAAGTAIWQSGGRIAAASSATEPAAPVSGAEPGRNVDAEIRAASEAARQEERDKADDAAFVQAKAYDTVAAYDSYLATWPSGRNAETARTSRVAAETRARNARAGIAPASYDAHDLSQLNANVAAAVGSARTARARAENAAARARAIAPLAEDAADRAHKGEAGYEVRETGEGVMKFRIEGVAARASGYAVSYPLAPNYLGHRYTGEWRYGARTGVSVEMYQKAATGGVDMRYEGEVTNGALHGYGAYYWPDGRRFFGSFLDNARSGPGVLEYSNGYRYEGEFSGNLRIGYGVLWDAQGRPLQSGMWSADNLVTSMPH